MIKRSRGLDDEPIRWAHANPLFDTREYKIKFTNGTREKYQANVIAENMFAQIKATSSFSYRKSKTTKATIARSLFLRE